MMQDSVSEAQPGQANGTAIGLLFSCVMGSLQKATTLNQSLQWTPVGEDDLVPGDRNGKLALTVLAEFKGRVCAPWQRMILIRLLGLRIGFATLCNWLGSLWPPTGTMEVKDPDHECFLVKLENEQDYFRALTNGAWKVKYENLPEVCFKCEKIGHNSGTCPQNKTTYSSSQENLVGLSPPASPSPSSEDSNLGFKPWMLATRKTWRNSGDAQRKGKVEQHTGTQFTIAKNRNCETTGKEANQSLPLLAISNGPSPQQSSAPERMVANGKKSGEDAKKGKGKVTNEIIRKGKGLLRSGPNSGN
ncbi:unnamed protein product [Linum tenue]|uniref:CCHC-type domain-containing protein n=1 Tax=Linum tenue TaxID=586396 RepID=A0AAV0MDY2_9ROSI|nr:unnamed protein product [Linum tenue]